MSLTIRFIPVQATPPPQATLKLAYVKGRQPATEHHLNTQSSNAPVNVRRLFPKIVSLVCNNEIF